MDRYPTLNFITRDPDYRPAVGPDGTVVIFERSAFQSGDAPTLYRVDDLGNPGPVKFIPTGGPASRHGRIGVGQ